LGLNHTEARLLTLLHQQNGTVTQEVLSDLVFVDRSNVGRAMKNLERDGHIKRRKDDADKRTNLVQIDSNGAQGSHRIAKLKKTMAQSFFGDLKEDEAGAIIDLLKKAVTNADTT
jgi:DNA-binding MarR family transcriptional regulator